MSVQYTARPLRLLAFSAIWVSLAFVDILLALAVY